METTAWRRTTSDSAGDEGNCIIPVYMSDNTETAKIYGLAAAREDIATLSWRSFPILPAFALTDFKLQGRTLPKLIMSIADRPFPPYIDLVAFYVMVSRVTASNGLRVLKRDPSGFSRIRNGLGEERVAEGGNVELTISSEFPSEG